VLRVVVVFFSVKTWFCLSPHPLHPIFGYIGYMESSPSCMSLLLVPSSVGLQKNPPQSKETRKVEPMTGVLVFPDSFPPHQAMPFGSQTSAQQPPPTSPSKVTGPGTSPVGSFSCFPPSLSSLDLLVVPSTLGCWTTAVHLDLGTLRKQAQVCGAVSATSSPAHYPGCLCPD
jgi:hypothetical protein